MTWTCLSWLQFHSSHPSSFPLLLCFWRQPCPSGVRGLNVKLKPQCCKQYDLRCFHENQDRDRRRSIRSIPSFLLNRDWRNTEKFGRVFSWFGSSICESAAQQPEHCEIIKYFVSPCSKGKISKCSALLSLVITSFIYLFPYHSPLHFLLILEHNYMTYILAHSYVGRRRRQHQHIFPVNVCSLPHSVDRVTHKMCLHAAGHFTRKPLCRHAVLSHADHHH